LILKNNYFIIKVLQIIIIRVALEGRLCNMISLNNMAKGDGHRKEIKKPKKVKAK